MIKETLQTLKEELKKEILAWNFTLKNKTDTFLNSIYIDWFELDFYIKEEKAFINPFQKIEFDLSENEQVLFFELLVWKWLNDDSLDKAIKEINRLSWKYNLRIKAF